MGVCCAAKCSDGGGAHTAAAAHTKRTLEPSAGPTGGAGLALPACSSSLILPVAAFVDWERAKSEWDDANELVVGSGLALRVGWRQCQWLTLGCIGDDQGVASWRHARPLRAESPAAAHEGGHGSCAAAVFCEGKPLCGSKQPTPFLVHFSNELRSNPTQFSLQLRWDLRGRPSCSSTGKSSELAKNSLIILLCLPRYFQRLSWPGLTPLTAEGELEAPQGLERKLDRRGFCFHLHPPSGAATQLYSAHGHNHTTTAARRSDASVPARAAHWPRRPWRVFLQKELWPGISHCVLHATLPQRDMCIVEYQA